jgi:site-specific recombinase XerD
MDFDGVPIVSQPSEERLNKRQLLDYQEHREAFISWLLALGKNPKGATGYSHATVRRTAYRTDQFNRWVWDQEETYTTNISHGHADDYMKELAYSEQSNTHKSHTQKSIKRFFTGSIFQQLLIELLVQQSVRILDTPVDSQWLRVRDGPSLRQPQNHN